MMTTQEKAAAELVGVLVVTFNSEKYVERCINSCFSDPSVGTVVVCDNGSSDGTLEILQTMQATNRRLVVLQRSDNPGFGVAMNTCRARCTEETLLVLNPDTHIERGAVGAMFKELKNSRVGVVGPVLRMASGELDPSGARRLPTLRSALMHTIPIVRSRAGYNLPSDSDQLEAISGACMLLSAQLWDDLGGFDEAFWMYGEDLDLCRRTLDRGRRVVIAPDATVLHYKFGSSGKYRTGRPNFEFYRAQWIYYRKHLASRHPRLVSAVVFMGVSLAYLATEVRNRARRSDHDTAAAGGEER